MEAYCDQFANVIYIDKKFIIINGINSINLETADKALDIKLYPHIIQEKSKTIAITYPPTKNLKSSTIKITYFKEDNVIGQQRSDYRATECCKAHLVSASVAKC